MRTCPHQCEYRHSRELGKTRKTADKLPSDSRSLSPARGQGDEGSVYVAGYLSDRVGQAKVDPWQMEDLLDIAEVAGQEDIRYFETPTGATEDGRGKIYDKLAAGMARLSRLLKDKEQPQTHAPMPPEIKIDGAPAMHPTLRNAGSCLLFAQ